MSGRPGPSPWDDEPERSDRPAGRRRPFGDSPRGRSGRRRRSGPSPDPDGPAAAHLADGAEPDTGDPADEPGDPESVARAICLRALTGAPKTRRQLAELLERRGVPEDAATAVLDRFGEVGLIDDAAFARAWVSSRQAGRGLARRALRTELRAKGVDGEDAEQALALVDDEDERAAARHLVERRLPALRRVDRVTATRRLVGMLARKGYPGGLAAGVVREVLDGTGFGTDPDPDGPDGPDWEDDLP
ncbi:regulatory protein [Geodermatophilus telluris]|uniref:Regulatory protein RecX n=1 Tax=Geodermatophilus telluris TaxID=1190417 RepID=A0A1G6PPJ2_9ACTN|nr:regulatory protein RecX [Geodermatophilus telluris]SDC81416.1 regulatory protein [Geodermatophilus telluris]